MKKEIWCQGRRNIEKQAAWFRSGSNLVPPTHSSSSQNPTNFLRTRFKLNLFRRKFVWSTEELEWNRRNLLGIRLEPGCRFLHVPCTLAPKSIFHQIFLGFRKWPKKVWLWPNCLSRSNEGRRNFRFATERFKCRPLLSSFLKQSGIIFLINCYFAIHFPRWNTLRKFSTEIMIDRDLLWWCRNCM